MFYYITLSDINTALSIKGLPALQSISYSNYHEYDYQSSLFLKHSKLPDLKNFQDFIIDYLYKTGHYLSVSITGKGFLSLQMNPSCVLHSNASLIDKKSQTIVIDYCGVNVAKKMHIGHIRSMFIGDYIANHHQYIGDTVIKYNHIGDWGNQFGYLLQYIIDYISPDELETLNNNDLTKIYKEAYTLYCADESFKTKANLASISLYNHDEAYLNLWNKCCSISIKEMNNTTNFFKLGIDESHIKGESQYFQTLPYLEKELLSSGLFTIGEDGSIVYISDKKTPLLIKKSNGAYLYGMYDLAAIKERLKKHNPDKIIYVVDKRQADHFKCIFEISNKMGWTKNCQLQHIAFGFILGKDGKPLKTKSGESLYLDDLIKDGFEQLSKNNFYSTLENNYKNNVLEKTLIGSLKFFDLHFSYGTDYQFDWDNVLSSTGGAAPYVMHAYVRIDSIVYKSKLKPIAQYQIDKFNENSISLFKKLYQLKEATYLYIDNYGSHLIEDSLLNLCAAIHYFYENENVINSENEHNLISLLDESMTEIKKVCSLLGIQMYPSISTWNKSLS